MEGSWDEEARDRIHNLLSELAATGKLNPGGATGMIMSGTVVVEFMGEDGQDWHAILGVPQERWRDLAVHAKLLERVVDNAESPDDE